MHLQLFQLNSSLRCKRALLLNQSYWHRLYRKKPITNYVSPIKSSFYPKIIKNNTNFIKETIKNKNL